MNDPSATVAAATEPGPAGFVDKARILWFSLPLYLRIYLGFLLVANFFIIFWVPVNDFDTMSTYLARIKLEEFGPLVDTATLPEMYIFPKFFDYLHAPFLWLGYFTYAPSAILFVVFVVLLIKETSPKVALIALFLCLTADPVITAVTSAKNDMPLAVFGFIAWYLIARLENSKYYLSLCTSALCAVIGTKWHGAFMLVVLGPFLIYRLATSHRPSWASLVVFGLFLPLFFIASSAEVYFNNYVRDGSFFPRPEHFAYHATGMKNAVFSVGAFLTSSVFDSFDWAFYALDRLSGGLLWSVVNVLTMNRKVDFIIMPNSHIAGFGFPILIVIACSLIFVTRREEDPALRVGAGLALFWAASNFYYFTYSTWLNRYFIATFIFGLIPTATLISRMSFKIGLRLRALLAAYLIGITGHVLLFDGEHRMVPVTLRDHSGNKSAVYSTIFHDFWDRDLLYYQIWTGYAEIHKYMRANVKLSDGLFFLNFEKGADAPFLYPLIKDRRPANTRIASVRFGGAWNPELCSEFRFVMTYLGAIDDPHYEMAYQYPGRREITIYRRKFPDCR
ncbi:MAG: hypothetical protein GC191_20360 [Azospirillum sp.]|nr:hypothetical protein [Azospirillum sp.]